MSSANIYTHAFDFYYKWINTSFTAYLHTTWSQHYIFSLSGQNVDMTASWYNFAGSNPIMTRHTSSVTATDGALPWASAATDFLWNVLNPSMSRSQSVGVSGQAESFYRFTYTSSGFLHNELGYGTVNYPVTSSWIAYEPKMIQYASGSGTSVGYRLRGKSTGIHFPAYLFTTAHAYTLPTAFTPPTSTYPNVGQNPSMLTYDATATGSGDGRFFDLAGGCGITRTAVSASLVNFNTWKNSTTVNGRHSASIALKQRRLFFPTISTGSATTPTGAPGIWVQGHYGHPSDQFFTENGGIYSVKFNLKRDVSRGYYPDEGESSQLLVYIHNVNNIIPAPSGRVPGTDGWYPPDNNIIRIKNSPAMSFVNPATGYLIESFNVNVIQYGTPAQLVFEASGSLDANQYFGCIIDDVEFCKIGVSTDPTLIKSTTPGQFITEAQQSK
jgi:hypothetical protein